LLFLVPAISQTHKSLENSQDFFVKTKTKTKTFTSRPRPRLYFLSSRRLETKTLVSRTTSLVVNIWNTVVYQMRLLMLILL